MIGKLLTIIEFMLIRPVRNYKTIEHISTSDVLEIHSAKCTSFGVKLDTRYYRAAETLSWESTPHIPPPHPVITALG